MNKREFVLAGRGSPGGRMTAPAQAATWAAQRRAHAQAHPATKLNANACCADWQAVVGERFVTLSPTGQRQDLHLQRVQPFPAAGRAPGSEGFALFFAVPAGGMALVADTHPLLHALTGQPVAICLQPAGHAADGAALYRADFERLG